MVAGKSGLPKKIAEAIKQGEANESTSGHRQNVDQPSQPPKGKHHQHRQQKPNRYSDYCWMLENFQ